MGYTEKKAGLRMANGGIDVSLISEVDMRNLCRATLEAVKRFYEDPENVRRFEEWKARRDMGQDN